MTIQTVHICTGGTLDEFPQVQPGDVVIGVDGGALRLLQAGIKPDVAVGDFDTIGETGVSLLQEAGVPLESFPAQKDATDTEIGLDLAMQYRPRSILLYGALGTRADHSLANLHLLWKAHQHRVWMEIVAQHNRIALLTEMFPFMEIRKGPYRYVSLLPLTPIVKGITLRGFLYPLENAELEIGTSLGISNELANGAGTVQLSEGALFVMQTRDP